MKYPKKTLLVILYKSFPLPPDRGMELIKRDPAIIIPIKFLKKILKILLADALPIVFQGSFKFIVGDEAIFIPIHISEQLLTGGPISLA